MEIRVAPAVRSNRSEADAWPVLQVAAFDAEDCAVWMEALQHAYSEVHVPYEGGGGGLGNRVGSSSSIDSMGGRSYSSSSRSPTPTRSRRGRSATFSAFRSPPPLRINSHHTYSRSRASPQLLARAQSPLVPIASRLLVPLPFDTGAEALDAPTPRVSGGAGRTASPAAAAIFGGARSRSSTPATIAAPAIAAATGSGSGSGAGGRRAHAGAGAGGATRGARASTAAVASVVVATLGQKALLRRQRLWSFGGERELHWALGLWLALLCAQLVASWCPVFAVTTLRVLVGSCHALLLWRIAAAWRARSASRETESTAVVLALTLQSERESLKDKSESESGDGGGSGGCSGVDGSGGARNAAGIEAEEEAATPMWVHPANAADAEALWRRSAATSFAASRSHSIIGKIYTIELGLPRHCFEARGALHARVAAQRGARVWELPQTAVRNAARGGLIFRISFEAYTGFFVGALSSARIGKAFEASMRLLPSGDSLAEEIGTALLLRQLAVDPSVHPDRCVSYICYTPPPATVDVQTGAASEASSAQLSMLSTDGMKIDVHALVRAAQRANGSSGDGAEGNENDFNNALASAARTISSIYFERTVDGLRDVGRLSVFRPPPIVAVASKAAAATDGVVDRMALQRFAGVWRDDVERSDSLDAFLQLMGIGYIARKALGYVVSTVSVLVVESEPNSIGGGGAADAAAAVTGVADPAATGAGDEGGADVASATFWTLATHTETRMGVEMEAYVLDGVGRRKRPKKAGADPNMRVVRTGQIVCKNVSRVSIVCATFRADDNWTISSTRTMVVSSDFFLCIFLTEFSSYT